MTDESNTIQKTSIPSVVRINGPLIFIGILWFFLVHGKTDKMKVTTEVAEFFFYGSFLLWIGLWWTTSSSERRVFWSTIRSVPFRSGKWVENRFVRVPLSYSDEQLAITEQVLRKVHQSSSVLALLTTIVGLGIFYWEPSYNFEMLSFEQWLALPTAQSLHLGQTLSTKGLFFALVVGELGCRLLRAVLNLDSKRLNSDSGWQELRSSRWTVLALVLSFGFTSNCLRTYWIGILFFCVWCLTRPNNRVGFGLIVAVLVCGIGWLHRYSLTALPIVSEDALIEIPFLISIIDSPSILLLGLGLASLFCVLIGNIDEIKNLRLIELYRWRFVVKQLGVYTIIVTTIGIVLSNGGRAEQQSILVLYACVMFALMRSFGSPTQAVRIVRKLICVPWLLMIFGMLISILKGTLIALKSSFTSIELWMFAVPLIGLYGLAFLLVRDFYRTYLKRSEAIGP